MLYKVIILLIIIILVSSISLGKEENLTLTKINHKKEDGTKVKIYLVKINPEIFNLEIYYGNNEGITIEDIKKGKDVEGAINCGFFQDPFLPVGLLISGGKTINPLDTYWEHTGVFYITTDPSDPLGICTKDVFYDTDVTEAVQSFPLLVWDGEPYVKYRDEDEAARSAVALDGEGKIILIATEEGITLYEFSRVLSNPEWNLKRALNLDGGSSTQMYLKGKLSLYGSSGLFRDNRVSNFLLIKRK